jgi:hypothetical protein
VLVECKNWNKPVDRRELTLFLEKLRSRYGRARLGFLIAPFGFAKTLPKELLNERRGEEVVVLLDQQAVERLIQSTDLNEALKKTVDHAAIGAR